MVCAALVLPKNPPNTNTSAFGLPNVVLPLHVLILTVSNKSFLNVSFLSLVVEPSPHPPTKEILP